MVPAPTTNTLRDLPIVVTGGGGYVGAAVAHALARMGANVIVVDSLVKGHRWAVRDLPLELFDIRDELALVRLFRAHKTRAVCHLAALATIPESCRSPDEYFDVNVNGTRAVLAAMSATGVGAVTFASTCAIYDAPSDPSRPLREGDSERPLSPYASSKQAAERMIREADAAGDVRATLFRFFNAAGADRIANVGEDHEPETHAIPRLIRWGLDRGEFAIFGADYSTRDGTCIRDYVHTDDLASAHAFAVAELLLGNDAARGVMNLGSGVGTSVRELVEMTCALMGLAKRPSIRARRDGDAATLLADTSRARLVLGWRPQRDLTTILHDAIWWESQRQRA